MQEPSYGREYFVSRHLCERQCVRFAKCSLLFSIVIWICTERSSLSLFHTFLPFPPLPSLPSLLSTTNPLPPPLSYLFRPLSPSLFSPVFHPFPTVFPLVFLFPHLFSLFPCLMFSPVVPFVSPLFPLRVSSVSLFFVPFFMFLLVSSLFHSFSFFPRFFFLFAPFFNFSLFTFSPLFLIVSIIGSFHKCFFGRVGEGGIFFFSFFHLSSCVLFFSTLHPCLPFFPPFPSIFPLLFLRCFLLFLSPSLLLLSSRVLLCGRE